MSYSVDLWNNYNNLEAQLESHIKGLKNFIYVLSSYYSSQFTFSTELKRLSDYIKNNPITSFESLNEGINSFQTDLLNQCDYLTEFLNNMKLEIIEPLKELKERINKRLNENLNETNLIEKNYNYCINQLDTYKNKFHKSVKEVEKNKLKIEFLKLKKSKNSAHNTYVPGTAKLQNFDENDLKKEEKKNLNDLKYAKECENNYISIITDTNNVQEDFIEIKKKNLNELQRMEEIIGNNIKDSLRKYIIYQVSYIRNFQYDIDKKAKIMENINILADISNFINKHISKDIPPFKYDYIPYLSELNKININNISKDIINDINNFIENNFTNNKTKEIIILKNKLNLEIESISEDIFISQINLEKNNNYGKIKEFCKNKKNRREFLRNLDNLRRKKGLNINPIAYNNIAKILNLCLDDIFNNNTINDILNINIDFISIIIIISLSSTLYKNSEEKKIFLIKTINNHAIWKKIEIWKDLIKYSIIEEMHNQKNFNRNLKEDSEAKKKRINNIVKFKINSFLYFMKNIEIKKNIVDEIILEFKNYYDLSEDIVDGFNKIFEDINNNIEETKNI